MRKNNITDLLDLQGVNLVNIKISKNFVEAWVKCPVKEHICPCCGETTSNIHDYYDRSFNHIKIGNKSSLIHYKQRRYVCTNCGKRFAESNSFITKFYRHSNNVVNNVFDDLTDIKNFTQIGKDNNISSQNVIRIMNKFVPILFLFILFPPYF